jgi:hypothetical protein
LGFGKWKWSERKREWRVFVEDEEGHVVGYGALITGWECGAGVGL